MRKLNRGTKPKCVEKHRRANSTWKELSTNRECNAEVWQHLETMQGSFCAYCESHLHERQRHIEHFFRRRDVPRMTFEWANFFGSCDEPDSCGKYKDNKASKTIDLAKVCKPDIMNPAEYLLFLSNGHVMPRDGLGAADAEIAENTIKVFNLNGSPKLVGKRRAAMRAERPLAKAYFQAMNDCLGEPDLESLLGQELEVELARISSSEYSVALRQVWEV